MRRALLLFTAIVFVLSAACAKDKKEKGARKNKKTRVVPQAVMEKDSKAAGYYTFDEKDVKGNVIIDRSPMKLNAYSNALGGAKVVDGKDGGGILFDGDEYIDIDEKVLSGEGATFAAWVFASKWIDKSHIFDAGDGMTHDVWCGADGGRLAAVMFGEEDEAEVSTALPKEKEWVHIALTFGDGKIVLYINGKEEEKASCNVKCGEIAKSWTGIYAGRSAWPDALFEGVMDNVCAFARALSAEEIAELAK